MSIETPKSPERRQPLDALMAQMAQELNAKYGAFLNTDCSVNMDSFAGKRGYDIEADKIEIEAREDSFSDAHTENENRLAYFADLGLTTPEKRLAYWKEKKEASENEKLEKAVVVLFNKILGPEFLVVRTSTFDDYINRVDTLIVDVKTEKVVGAFDEVRGKAHFERNREKEAKVLEKAQRGGAYIKYGINLEKDMARGGQGLLKKELNNLPLFMISLAQDELKDLLKNMNYDTQGKVSGVELKVFNQLMESFEEQVKTLESNNGIRGQISANIRSFKESLGRMKQLGKTKGI